MKRGFSTKVSIGTGRYEEAVVRNTAICFALGVPPGGTRDILNRKQPNGVYPLLNPRCRNLRCSKVELMKAVTEMVHRHSAGLLVATSCLFRAAKLKA